MLVSTDLVGSKNKKTHKTKKHQTPKSTLYLLNTNVSVLLKRNFLIHPGQSLQMFIYSLN